MKCFIVSVYLSTIVPHIPEYSSKEDFITFYTALECFQLHFWFGIFLDYSSCVNFWSRWVSRRDSCESFNLFCPEISKHPPLLSGDQVYNSIFLSWIFYVPDLTFLLCLGLCLHFNVKMDCKPPEISRYSKGKMLFSSKAFFKNNFLLLENFLFF